MRAKKQPTQLTEADWLTSEDGKAMMTWLLSDRAGKVVFRPSDRKLRQLICVCARSIWGVLNPGNRRLVEAQERNLGRLAEQGDGSAGWWPVLSDLNADLAIQTAVNARETSLSAPGAAALVRELLGNPFRPVAVAPAWLTADVCRLATGAYENNAFADLPILADALEDAGCTSAELLQHLRSNAPHVRGCWAVDLILGTN